MKPGRIAFFLAGLSAGVISATLGSREPSVLTIGVGFLFFIAVVAAIAITGVQQYIHVGLWRYLAGAMLSAGTYVFAVLAFNVVGGLSQQLGVRPSGDLLDFRLDVWLGLIAAGAVATSGIALFGALLTGKWSHSLLLRLTLVGLVTIVVTFIANLPFHSYWSFFGVLLPLGNALFCWLVGAQIWRKPEAASQAAATTPTA